MADACAVAARPTRAETRASDFMRDNFVDVSDELTVEISLRECFFRPHGLIKHRTARIGERLHVGTRWRGNPLVLDLAELMTIHVVKISRYRRLRLEWNL